MPDSNPLQPGQRFGNGRFVLVRALGRGGMGEVWLAQDERLQEQVALKFLPSEIRGDPVALDNLRRETARSHKLTHPNIVRIHDLHEDADGTAFIIMEYVDGPTLAALRLQQPHRVFAWDFLRPLLEQLCAALANAHGEKVIHRDLKPANMMLDGRGRLKLADFGIAAVASDSMSRVSVQHTTSGTLLYMSPQQLTGKRAQATDDIYALGATLYELLTSQPPFHTGDLTHQVLHEAPEPMEERLAALEIQNEIPPDVSALIMACLAKEPGQRPQSAPAVAAWIGLEVARKPSLEALSQDVFSSAPPATPEIEEVAPAAPGSGKKALWAAGVFAALLLLAAGGWYWAKQAQGKKSLPKETSIPTVPVEAAATTASEARAAVPAMQTSTAPAMADLKRGLALYFSFNEPPKNGVVHDESGLGNDGQVVGAKWTVEGKSGGGLVFSPANCYVRVSNNESLNPARVTLAAWIKTERADPAWRRIFDKNFASGFALSVTGDWKGWKPPSRFRGHVSFELNRHEIHSDQVLSDGQWHHIVATYDGSTQFMFVDGVRQANTHAQTGEVNRNEFNLRLGGYEAPDPVHDNPRNSFDGVLDEVMMFNRALSDDEIRQLYESPGLPSAATTDTSATTQTEPPSTLAPAVLEDGFIPLFNGHDLSGWDGDPRFWSVEGNAIKGQTTPGNIPENGNTYLIWTNGDVDDFELRFSYKLVDGDTGSGVQYRGRRISGWKAQGYHADFWPVANGNSGSLAYEAPGGGGRPGFGRLAGPGEIVVWGADGKKHVTGTTPKSAAEIQAAIREGDWNDYVITAVGNHLVHQINGNMTMEMTDNDVQRRFLSGLLGLKVRPNKGNPMLVYFKNIRLKKLAGGSLLNDVALPAVGLDQKESWVFTTIAGKAGSLGSRDGIGSDAQFNGPVGIAVDKQRNIYVADLNNHTIRLIKPSGDVSTLAGLAGTAGSSDGVGANAQFRHPRRIAVDRDGNVYVDDSGNNTIRKITPVGMVTTVAGRPGSSGSDDGPTAIARFNHPGSVDVVPDGTIFVADFGNNTIRKITPMGLVSTVAGQAGVKGSVDGPGPSARFNQPNGLIVGARGFIYVTDAGNHTIRAINPSRVVRTLAGQPGAIGSADGLTTSARFSSPRGIAVDGEGNLYVTDTDNSTIRKITSAGAVTTIGGLAGSSGSSDGSGAVARFNHPTGLALDTQGNIYVCDNANNTIRKGHRQRIQQ